MRRFSAFRNLLLLIVMGIACSGNQINERKPAWRSKWVPGEPCPNEAFLCHNAEAMKYLNNLRRIAGVKRYKLGSLALTKDAFEHSKKMAKMGRQLHTDLNAINAADKYKCDEFLVAELVAVHYIRPGQNVAAKCLDPWKLSRPHLNAMNLGRLDEAALGAYVSGNRVWCTLLLAVNTHHTCTKPVWPPPSSTPSMTPTSSTTPSPTPSASVSASSTPSISSSPSASLSIGASPSMTSTPSLRPSFTLSATSAASPTQAPTPTFSSTSSAEIGAGIIVAHATVTPRSTITATLVIDLDSSNQNTMKVTPTVTVTPSIAASTFGQEIRSFPFMVPSPVVVSPETYQFSFGKVNIKYPTGLEELVTLQCFGDICRYCTISGGRCYSASFSILLDLYLKKQNNSTVSGGV